MLESLKKEKDLHLIRCNEVYQGHESPPQPQKRKRVDTTPEKKQTCWQEGANAQTMLTKICSEIRALDKVVKESYNAKKEIKDITQRLSYHAEHLSGKALNRWQQIADKAQAREEQCQRQSDKIARLKVLVAKLKLGQVEKPVPTVTRQNRKCQECRREQEQQERLEKYRGTGTFAAYQAVDHRGWEECFFPRDTVTTDQVWDTSADTAVILPCDRAIDSTDRAVRQAIHGYGGKGELVKQKQKLGEVAMMSHTLGFPNDAGEQMQITRDIYYPIVLSEAQGQEVDERTIYRASEIVRRNILQRGSKSVALLDDESAVGLAVRKSLPFVFSDTEVQLLICRSTQKNWAERVKAPTSNRQGATGSPKVKGRKRAPRQDALLVKLGDASYAATLRAMKMSINPSEIGVDVKTLTKTLKGEILVTTAGGPEKMELLKKEIEAKMPLVQTKLLSEKKVLHIKDLDEETTEEEVQTAITEVTGSSAESVDLRARRPAYGGTYNITAVVNRADAGILLKAGTIRIGWGKCRIQERITAVKCYRCWEYGHTKTQCDGPDRENLCLNCAQEGHKAADCVGTSHCVACERDGHRTGQGNCQKRIRPRPQTNRKRNGVHEDSADKC